jgi:hypothetical protein
MYFVVVITYFNLFGDPRHLAASSLGTLVASSCVTRLYHEMYIRDDINFLLGVNTWYMMVAAVPQLRYNSIPQQGDVCAQELDIIVKALEHMQIKFAGAAPVLRTINRLRASPTPVRIRPGSPTTSDERHTDFATFNMNDLRGLFPFPASFSPRLELTLADGPSWMDLEQAEPTWAHEDFGSLFDEFWDMPLSPFEPGL